MTYTKLFHIVGLISAFTLGIGFVTGVISVWLSWQISKEQALEIEKLRKENFATESRLGEERDKRLELEKSIAPRELRLLESDGRSNIDPLKPFAGTEVILWYFPDDEPLRATLNIDALLRKAGWNSGTKGGEKRELSHAFFDGVVVEPNLSATDGNTDAAADVLVEFLRANNWMARKWIDEASTVPANTIRVNIGMKPMPLLPEPRNAGRLEPSLDG